MSTRIERHELVRLRNDLPIREVIYALGIPWKMDDELLRFRCPKCERTHTSVHPNQNLGRCFDCLVNFNPIDLASIEKKVDFRSAVTWLRALDALRHETGYANILLKMSKRSRMN